MASTAGNPNGITLLNAPDADIGTPQPKAKPVQVMQLDLSREQVDDMLRSARNGKGIQLALGHTPALRFGNKTLDLRFAPEKFRHELYRHEKGGNTSKLSFAGLASHTLEVQKPASATAGVDEALERLKSSMALHKEEKDARKTQLYTTPALPSQAKRAERNKAASSAFLKKPALVNNNVTRSLPASPSCGPAPTTPREPPTSAPLNPPKTSPLRHAIVHLLAVQPRTDQAVQEQTRGTKKECKAILEMVTKPLQGSEWQLSDKAYKELDPWKFPYKTQGERKTAIDNAIRAYDRMRISREDKLWQMLLPKEERGKGKILSRLNFQESAIGTPRARADLGGSPAMTNGAEKNNFLHLADALQSEPMSRAKSQDSVKTRKPGEKDALSKRLLSKKPGKAAAPSVKPKEKDVQPKKKGQLVSNSKVKSAEYIDDEDDQMDDLFGDDQMDDLVGEEGGDEAGLRSATAARPKLSQTPKDQPKKARVAAKPREQTSEISKKDQTSKTKAAGNTRQPQIIKTQALSSQPSPSSSAPGHRSNPSLSSNSSSATPNSRLKTSVAPSKASQLQPSPPASSTVVDKSRPGKSQPSLATTRVTNGAITPISQASISRPESQASISRTPSSNIAERERIYSTDKDMKRMANDLGSRAHGAPSSQPKSQPNGRPAAPLNSPESDKGINQPTAERTASAEKRKRDTEDSPPGGEQAINVTKRSKVSDPGMKSQLNSQKQAAPLNSPESDKGDDQPTAERTSSAEKRKRDTEDSRPGGEQAPNVPKRGKVWDYSKVPSPQESDNGDLSLSKRQAVELAIKYKDEYYPAYERLYKEVDGSDVSIPENQEKYERLLKFQERLLDMRRQMGTAYPCALEDMYVDRTGEEDPLARSW